MPGVYDVGIGDFNQDGIRDIAAISLSLNRVSILIGSGNGNYLPPANYPTGITPHHLTVVDLDSDGALDLLTANYTASSVTVLYGNTNGSGVADGTFGNSQVLAAGPNTFDLIAVDLNGDGKLDIATTNRGDGTSTIYRGLGGRQFLRMPTLSVGPQPYHLVAADFNGDGSADLAFTSLTSHQVTLFAGNGSMAFQPKGSLGLTNAYRLAVGDFNLDGRVDLVSSTAGNGSLQTWLGVGSLSADAGGPYSVAVGAAFFLDGTKSSFAINGVLTYQWDLDYDGMAFQADASGRTALFDASQMVAGQQRTVALRVMDSSGKSHTSAAFVSVVGLNSDLDGAPLTGDERVNTATSRDQMYPALAMNNRVTDIVAQRFDSNFNRIGAEFIVNETSAGYQYSPAVAISSRGFVTFTWTSPGQDGSGFGIFARTMGPGTNQMGHEFQVNSVSIGDQNTRGNRQSLAYTPNGETVMTWWGNGPGDNVGVFQRRFASRNRGIQPVIDNDSSPNLVLEDALVGSLVGVTALAIDPDALDTVTYALTDNAGGRFAIHSLSGVVSITDAIDHETRSSHTIVVRATSSDGSSSSAPIVISVTNVNEAPTTLTLDSTSISENTATATNIGTLNTTDPDASETFTYTLVADFIDNANFQIAGDKLQTKDPLDFETKSSYSILVRTTDAGGLFTEQTFTISVEKVNEPPTSMSLTPRMSMKLRLRSR